MKGIGVAVFTLYNVSRNEIWSAAHARDASIDVLLRICGWVRKEEPDPDRPQVRYVVYVAPTGEKRYYDDIPLVTLYADAALKYVGRVITKNGYSFRYDLPGDDSGFPPQGVLIKNSVVIGEWVCGELAPVLIMAAYTMLAEMEKEG